MTTNNVLHPDKIVLFILDLVPFYLGVSRRYVISYKLLVHIESKSYISQILNMLFLYCRLFPSALYYNFVKLSKMESPDVIPVEFQSCNLFHLNTV